LADRKIIVTGCAGFIGYHLSMSLLSDGYEVCGLDNLNNYYDVSLKNSRLKELNIYNNFSFNNIDISNSDKINSLFKKFKPERVINLAAQAGVRYSIENPHAYMESNFVGFLNIIEACRHYGIDGLIYASSSSVYGGNKKMPFSPDDRVDNPISLYAASKKSNELIANSYSHLFDLHTTGLRFFTVYGPWGRPDMAMLIFTRKIMSGRPIPVYNNGKMKRDFTYIDDIIAGIRSAIDKNYKCEIFNLGNSKSEKLMKVVALIEKYTDRKAEIDFLPMQPGDVPESYADISKSIEMLDFKPKTNIDIGVKNLINWYKNYYN
tara:strand:- start:734 stop:1693 length:960 start_codon:yes stop_codon:yes gene_type:complete